MTVPRWTLVSVFLLLSAAAAFAQTSPWDRPPADSPWNPNNPNSPWNPNRASPNRGPVEAPWTGPSPVGNWIAEYGDYPKPGQLTRVAFSVSEPMTLQCTNAPNGGCYLRLVPDPNSSWQVRDVAKLNASGVGTIPRKATDGQLTMSHGFFFFHEVAQTKLRPSGANMIGQWTRGGTSGRVAWQRRLPRVTRVKFVSAIQSETTPGGPVPRVQVTYDKTYWDSRTPSYTPRWTVEVYGENLWGGHVVHFPKDVDIVAGQPAPIQQASAGDPLAANIVGFSVPVWILGERPGREREVPKATPGRKTLVVDTFEIPFDLDIVNFPGQVATAPKLLDLRYVELRDGKFVPIGGELKHGAVFYVEAAFDAAPAAREYVVKLQWDDGPGNDVTVTSTAGDPKVFRSGAIQLKAPAVTR